MPGLGLADREEASNHRDDDVHSQARIPAVHLPAEAEALRGEVRSFLKEALPKVKTEDRFASWNTFSPEFSKALGKKGWIGIAWPKHYGGSERSFLDRYVITEELLGDARPRRHWVADRQWALLLRFGSEGSARRSCPGSRPVNATSRSA